MVCQQDQALSWCEGCRGVGAGVAVATVIWVCWAGFRQAACSACRCTDMVRRTAWLASGRASGRQGRGGGQAGCLVQLGSTKAAGKCQRCCTHALWLLPPADLLEKEALGLWRRHGHALHARHGISEKKSALAVEHVKSCASAWAPSAAAGGVLPRQPCFCPGDGAWRRKACRQGVELGATAGHRPG